jgi:hypothetical protein
MIRSMTMIFVTLLPILFSGTGERAEGQRQTTPCTRKLCGDPLFGYAWFPLRDAVGKPVINPRVGKPYLGDLCVIWYTGAGSRWDRWVAPPGEDRDDWLTGAEYYVDVSKRTATFTVVTFFNVVSTSDPKGYRLVDSPKRMAFKLDPPVVIRLYEQRQQAEPAALGHPDWNRTCEWERRLAGWYHYYEPGGGGGVSGPTLGEMFPCLFAWNDELRRARGCPRESQ